MKMIKKANCITSNNSVECSTIEYSFINKAIDSCVAIINCESSYCKVVLE